MKKVLMLLLVLAMVIGVFAGCSNNGSQSDTTGTTAPPPTEATGTGKDDITNQGRYTVSDEAAIAAKDTVVATCGEYTLTNNQLQIYYWMGVYEFIQNNYYYLSYYGLDPSISLSMQVYDKTTGKTWEQYFLQSALNSWLDYISLMQKAEAENYKLSDEMQEALDALEDNLKKTAEQNKLDSVDALIQGDLGAGTDLATYEQYMKIYYTASMFFTEKVANFKVTDDDLEAYFSEHAEELKTNYSVTKDSGDLVNVRHILIKPKNGTTTNGTTTYSDEEWEKCRKEAQALLDQWKAGAADEDSFAALANEKSTDTGSNTNGGLYSGVNKGKMVEPFDTWIFDESREYGDSGLVKTTYGYHIMFFVKREPGWVFYSRDGVMGEMATEYLENAVKEFESTIDYSKISIAEINLAG